MTKWFLRKAIDKFERDWNYDASHSDNSGVTYPSRHGAPLAFPPCATRTAVQVRS